MSPQGAKPANMAICWPRPLQIGLFRILFSWPPDREGAGYFKIIPRQVILSVVGEFTPRFWEPSITALVKKRVVCSS